MTIKELRRVTHMNIKQFSEYLNIPYRTVQNWERGERECPKYLLDLIEFKIVTEYKIDKELDDRFH